MKEQTIWEMQEKDWPVDLLEPQNLMILLDQLIQISQRRKESLKNKKMYNIISNKSEKPWFKIKLNKKKTKKKKIINLKMEFKLWKKKSIILIK